MSRIWRVITAALSCPVWVPKKRPSPLCVLALDPSSGHLTRTSVFLCHFQSSNSEYITLASLPPCVIEHLFVDLKMGGRWWVGSVSSSRNLDRPQNRSFLIHWLCNCALCSHTWQQSSAQSFQICILSRRVTDAESSILYTLDFFGPEKASLKSSHLQVPHVSQSLV